MLATSAAFTPVVIKGMVIHPEDPLKFDFIMDTGTKQPAGAELKAEAERSVKYFLASLTTPEDQMWVNLSPVEKDRIIPDAFGKTVMGRDLLGEDYVLKQLSSSLTFPDSALGKEFWARIYAEAAKRGVSDINTDMMNRVWIVPSEAQVWENDGKVFILKSHLKVMLEQDYLTTSNAASPAQDMSTRIMRDMLIPALEKEVNEGEHFARLRQIYAAMILSAWYKIRLKDTLLGAVYADKNKVPGVEFTDSLDKQKIYNNYLQTVNKGVYNFIREDKDLVTGETLPRKYFSGGFNSAMLGGLLKKALILGVLSLAFASEIRSMEQTTAVRVGVNLQKTSKPGVKTTQPVVDVKKDAKGKVVEVNGRPLGQWLNDLRNGNDPEGQIKAARVLGKVKKDDWRVSWLLKLNLKDKSNKQGVRVAIKAALADNAQASANPAMMAHFKDRFRLDPNNVNSIVFAATHFWVNPVIKARARKILMGVPGSKAPGLERAHKMFNDIDFRLFLEREKYFQKYGRRYFDELMEQGVASSAGSSFEDLQDRFLRSLPEDTLWRAFGNAWQLWGAQKEFNGSRLQVAYAGPWFSLEPQIRSGALSVIDIKFNRVHRGPDMYFENLTVFSSKWANPSMTSKEMVGKVEGILEGLILPETRVQIVERDDQRVVRVELSKRMIARHFPDLMERGLQKTRMSAVIIEGFKRAGILVTEAELVEWKEDLAKEKAYIRAYLFIKSPGAKAIVSTNNALEPVTLIGRFNDVKKDLLDAINDKAIFKRGGITVQLGLAGAGRSFYFGSGEENNAFARRVLQGVKDLLKDNAIDSAKELEVKVMPGLVVLTASDAAMNRADAVGGIDLNTRMLDIEIKRDPKGFPLPAAQQDWAQVNIDGLTPVIDRIEPVNITRLLGNSAVR